MKVLVTGSLGLIGSEAVDYFLKLGHKVVGCDRGLREEWFGAPTAINVLKLMREFPDAFSFVGTDVQNADQVSFLFNSPTPYDVVIHCAAQPSHDLAAKMPQVDFHVNAVGTLNLLEETRRHCPNATFIFMSTNKVYGDRPNHIKFQECPTRYEHPEGPWWPGFTENLPIDQSLHSLFGASKVAADIMVQEYGRYFGLNTVVFRAGCLTGWRHAGAEQHGFLSYLAKCVMKGKRYKVYGYKGKQVRDQLHSSDMIRAMAMVIGRPPKPGAVYNIGGGRLNSISVIEAIEWMERIANKRLDWVYTEAQRLGDHICYITDFWRFKADYPQWDVTYDLDRILVELVENERSNPSQQVQTEAVR